MTPSFPRNGVSGLAGAVQPEDTASVFDVDAFINESDDAMRAEFGFTLTELRTVCGGLLDMASADRVTHIHRADAVSAIAESTSLDADVVDTVLTGISLTARGTFLEIHEDAWPWRLNRDISYVRRPLVLQGEDLVYGFRTVYRLGLYWVENLLSGRLQGRAKTAQMRTCITEARRHVNQLFALSVATRLGSLGMVSRVSVKKFNRRWIVNQDGQDLGDVDVLAYHEQSGTILAVEAKDFEIARTPSEMSNEIKKLFSGKGSKRSTVELRGRRVDWLRLNIVDVMDELGIDPSTESCDVHGLIVTRDPLITPLVESSPMPIVPFEDVDLATLGVESVRARRAR